MADVENSGLIASNEKTTHIQGHLSSYTSDPRRACANDADSLAMQGLS